MSDQTTTSTPPTRAFALAGKTLTSRFFLGTAGYPSPSILQAAVSASGAQVLTMGLKRQLASLGHQTDASQAQQNPWWQLVRETGCSLLPNTAGCHTAREAIALAQMARELFETHWIKLEVVEDDYMLKPSREGLLAATEVLVREGFEVFPYCTEDRDTTDRLVDLGCRILMPWGAPIGSGQGLSNPHGLEALRSRHPSLFLVVDAGIGAPSHAAAALEMGYDAVLLNSAVAQAQDPVAMAQAFGLAIAAGRQAFEAGIIPKQPFAQASTQTGGRPFDLGTGQSSGSG